MSDTDSQKPLYYFVYSEDADERAESYTGYSGSKIVEIDGKCYHYTAMYKTEKWRELYLWPDAHLVIKARDFKLRKGFKRY
jgi:hypothetical protein